jgi:hypothetical protein
MLQGGTGTSRNTTSAGNSPGSSFTPNSAPFFSGPLAAASEDGFFRRLWPHNKIDKKERLKQAMFGLGGLAIVALAFVAGGKFRVPSPPPPPEPGLIKRLFSSKFTWGGLTIGGLGGLEFWARRQGTTIIGQLRKWMGNASSLVSNPASPQSLSKTLRPIPNYIEALKAKAIPNGQQLTLEELFGTNLKNNTSRQQSGYSCYVLSALDNILQHPQAENMLKAITVRKLSDTAFEVNFHKGSAIEVTVNDLRASDVATSDHLGVPLLEQAYLKTLPENERREYGESLHVFEALVPERLLPSSTGLKEYRANDSDYKTYLQQLIQDSKDHPDNTPLLSIGSHAHIRSLRLHASNKNEIAYFEPFAGAQNMSID